MSRRRARRSRPGRSSRWRRFARRTPPGALPGTILSDPAAPPPCITLIAYGPTGAIEKACASPEEAAAERGRHAVVWVNVDGLGDAAVISRLGELFGLHRLALEDVVNVHQRAKVEPYGEHVFMVFREARFDEGLEMDQISLFVGRDFIITFQERAGDAFDPVRDRIRRNKGRVTAEGADYLAYALIDAIIDACFPVLEKYGERLEALEDETIDHPGRETVQAIHDIKRDFLTLRRAIWPAREALSTIIREDLPPLGAGIKVFFRDCYDHTVQLIDMLETYRETGSDLMEVYLSSLSNRMNEVIKVLTIISTIFMPLGFIAGVYGMNFSTAHPLNMPELSWRYGYIAVLSLMGLVAAGLLLYFRRRGWLGRDHPRPRERE